MKSQRMLKVAIAAALTMGMTSAVFAQADNTNSKIAPASSFSGWMTDYSKNNQGRISRDAYMQESGRRWDAMDQSRQGLTTEQLSTLYGYPNTGMPAMKDNMTTPASPMNVKK